jgi:hypothetical protein
MLQKTLQGVAGVDLDEIRWRFACANLDVSECVGAEGYLLPDEDVLGWHARIEVSEAKIVARNTLEE